MAQQPSIGRVVHYQSFGTPKGEYDSLARVAVITEVGPDGVVGLCVLNPTGQFFNREVPFSTEPKAGHWNCPPYVAPTTAAPDAAST